MTATSKRALLAGAGLVALLVAGLVVAQTLGGDDDNSTVVDSPTPPTTPTEASPTPTSPKAEVRAAYLEQWDVYAEAVRTLQSDRLDEVFTNEALSVVRQEVRVRLRKGTPLRVQVKHDLAVKVIDPITAVVDDRYINHSVEFEPETGKPTEPDPNEIIHEVYTLKKVNGVWKVSAIVRQSVRPRKD